MVSSDLIQEKKLIIKWSKYSTFKDGLIIEAAVENAVR